VSLAIALDSSGSMAGERRELAAEALRALFVLLDPRDELSLVVFAGDVVVPLTWARVGQMPGLEWPQWVVPPTRTALLDAVMQGLSLMDAATESRHVLLVVSDGFEWRSTATWPDLVKTRRQSETEVYAFRTLPWRDRQQARRVGTLDGARAMPRLDAMGALVGDSGGIVHEIGTGQEVALATMAFTSTLRNQYLLAYETPRPLDGTYRRIKVEARGHTVRVRHRGGYLALPAPK
jgi:VWFA-related protein